MPEQGTDRIAFAHETFAPSAGADLCLFGEPLQIITRQGGKYRLRLENQQDSSPVDLHHAFGNRQVNADISPKENTRCSYESSGIA